MALDAKDAVVVAGWFLTIVGWLVSSVTANKRERRKEARTEVDACAKMAHELLGFSRDYYTRPASDVAVAGLGAKIRFEVQRLVIRVERLEKKHAHFDVANSVSELYDAITGGDFDSKTREASNFDSDVLLKIESDVHFLIDQLEEGFFRAFP